MTANIPRPRTEALTIAGPAGQLEALLDVPLDAREADVSRVAVICHPHPLHGGTMTNKVVHMLARAFNEVGVPSLRFNYRGVGASAGSYGEGEGETQDALAVADWLAQRWPGASLWLGGFSFGGAIAMRTAVKRDARLLVTVAPAIRHLRIDESALPRCPWLLVQGDSDELVDAADVQGWAAGLSAPPELALLPGVSHYFHGRLNELRTTVLDWLQRTGLASGA